MALVTYHGPRPELVPAMPVVHSYITEELVVVGPIRTSGKPKFASLYAPVLPANKPVPCDPLYALGLALVRRRPSPWFTVRFAKGEYAEIAHRIRAHGDTMEDLSAMLNVPLGAAPFRGHVLALLNWTAVQIRELYAGEQKVMIVNGDLVWAPAGWKAC